LVGMREENIVAVSFRKAGRIFEEYLRGAFAHVRACGLACGLGF